MPPAKFPDEATRRWVEGLRPSAPRHREVLGELQELLRRAALHETNRRRDQLGRATGPEIEDIADQAANDALLAILKALDDFRGESRFTTWAYKFVVFQVSAKVSRHAWRRQPPPATDFVWDGVPDRGEDPTERLGRRELLAALGRAVSEDLTERQREVFVAIAVNEVPIDAVALQLGSNRNAVYKNLFDARRTLRACLARDGFSLGDEPEP